MQESMYYILNKKLKNIEWNKSYFFCQVFLYTYYGQTFIFYSPTTHNICNDNVQQQ